MVGVDLGLPSGLLWASQNVGADRQIDAGLYFSWGNVDGHTENDGYVFSNQAYAATPGYQLVNNIDLAHDAARVNLGGPWRMPSNEEMVELLENCSAQMTTIDGVYGCIMQSRINGAELFFPAGGYGAGSGYTKKGEMSLIWSTRWSSASRAYNLLLEDGTMSAGSLSLRTRGFNIRPVADP